MEHAMSDKISEGLETLERARKGQPVPSAKGSPISVKALQAMARDTQRARRRLKERINAVKIHMEKWKAQREKLLASLPADKVAELIAAEWPQERDNAIEKHVQDIIKFRVTIHIAAKSLDATARIFRDSVAYLDVNTLGSGRRSVLDRQLEGAGPARLADAFLTADALGDSDMYAAANAKLGNLSKADKELVATRVNTRSIADSLVGDQLKAAVGAVAAIQFFDEEARFDADEMVGKPHAMNAKIELGSRQLVAERDGPEYLKDEEPTEPNSY
jgi:hypothetical protein